MEAPLSFVSIMPTAESIRFHFNDVPRSVRESGHMKDWITAVAAAHGRTISDLDFVFCSDTFLLNINKQFLKHDYLTDIITFDLADQTKEKEPIQGEIYISVDRVKENALELGIPFKVEISRVIIHGVLHLLGYRDKTKAEKVEMREKEEACLSLLHVPRETLRRRARLAFHVKQ